MFACSDDQYKHPNICMKIFQRIYKVCNIGARLVSFRGYSLIYLTKDY